MDTAANFFRSHAIVPGVDSMTDADELRAFLLVLRRALLMIVAYINKRYGIAE